MAIATYFAFKIASGLLLLKLSAAWLSVEAFGVFSQLLLLGALVTMIAVGGSQNGVIRQIAASAGRSLDRVIGAATMLWVGASLAILVPAGLFGSALSELLTGRPDHALACAGIVAAALLSGPGQIACAALAGLRRSSASLSVQALGMLAGTAAAAWLIGLDRPAAAAVAFYAASLIAGPVGWAVLLRSASIARVPLRAALSEARTLLGYSAAFVTVASYSAITLFGLRYAYLSSFGTEPLGYWLVAQRISDTSTQLVGLFMTQYMIPAYAIATEPQRRSVVKRSWLTCTAAMAVVGIVFAAWPWLWIRLLLSDAYQPAVAMVLAYMAGDALRATTSVAMHAALARGRPLHYVAIGVAVTTVMAVATLVLIANGTEHAPAVGYVGAHAAFALLFGVIFLIGNRFRGSS